MPNLDDFHAFTSTSGSGGGSGGSGGSGCSSGCLPWILGILAFLWIIGKLGS